MDVERQVQSPVDIRTFRRGPLAFSSSPAGKLILLSEGDSVYKRGARETTLGRGWFDYYVRSSETERKGKTDRPFDAKWILEKVFPRRGGCVCSRAVRLVFPIPSPPPDAHTMRRLPFDSDASRSTPRVDPSGSLCTSGSNKAESAFPPFRIQRLTSETNFARRAITVSVFCILASGHLVKLLAR